MGAGRTHMAHRLHVQCPGIRRFESELLPLAFIFNVAHRHFIYCTPILDTYLPTCIVS